MTTAALSRLLFSPVMLLLYTGGMLAYLHGMAYGSVGNDGRDVAVGDRRSIRLATALASLGVLAHVAHIVARAVASGRLPLGNMFEFSSVMALTVVVGGLVFVQRRLRRPELMGFVLLAALVTLGMSALLYTEPGPLSPILDTWWRSVHVTTIVLAFGLLSLAVVFAALALVRDLGERRFAALPDGSAPFAEASVGAAQAPVDVDDELGDGVAQRVGKDRGDAEEHQESVRSDVAYAEGLREVTAQRWFGVRLPWRVATTTAVLALGFSLLFSDAAATVALPVAAFAIVVLGWWSVPFLPPSSELEKLNYRTTTFAFPILTFAIITGAMWAEQSWGRYWGWDPKETSAFVTWVAYAGYLHARATRGFRGRRSAWVALGAFVILLFTYYGVNLFISGLHSYAGLDAPAATNLN